MYTRALICLMFSQFYLSTGIYWRRYGGRKFVLIKDFLTWFDAQTVCNSLGGRLAHADTSSVNNFLISLTDKRSFVWLGGADIHTECDWKWYHPEKSMRYTYWLSYGPQPDQGRVSNCLTYWYSYAGYKWADEPCHLRYNFICEKTSR